MIAQIDINYIKKKPTKLVSRLLSYSLFEGRSVTTKGQWINSYIFFQYRLINALPQIKKVRKPIFIIGTGRSGTTLLGVLLSLHNHVGFLNEPKLLWHSIYPNEDLIGSYSKGPARYRLTSEDATPDVIISTHKIYGAYLTAVCSNRVVDKYPELIFRIPFVKQIFPDAKFIFLVRNGWDTCCSIKKWSDRKKVHKTDEVHDWWGINNRKWHLLLEQVVTQDEAFSDILTAVKAYTQHTDMALIEWIVTMREGLKQMDKYGDCMKMIKYEDLLRYPEKILTDILDFCQLSSDSVFMDYAKATIRPPMPYEKFTLGKEIKPLFDETMQKLGY